MTKFLLFILDDDDCIIKHKIIEVAGKNKQEAEENLEKKLGTMKLNVIDYKELPSGDF